MDNSKRAVTDVTAAEPGDAATSAEADGDELADALADLHRRITRHEHAVNTHLNRPH
ncbi:hypothetical protein OHS18_47880 [Amycolatopsis sp. NBC_00355]|uniref:hypothetical protein n=1 Tax=Amycolatopsis sp. NBC_00355 TaxID=2975957 RepID=UPI002E26A7A6